MSRFLHLSAFGLFFATALLAIPLWGQSPQATPAAPVPAQIMGAKKVFISNAGEESSYWMQRNKWYGDDRNRAYNQFYSAMKSWGQYELVSAPSDADLVFEIYFEVKASREASISEMATFRLLILDPKTRMTLWAFTSYVEPANRVKARDKNYDSALTTLVGDVKTLVSPTTSAHK